MVKVFLDTEFTGFSSADELISVGFLAEDGRVFYQEVSDYDRKKSSDFVKSVVEPLLTPEISAVPKSVVAKNTFNFIEALGPDVVIMADYKGDFAQLEQLWSYSLPNNIKSFQSIYEDLQWYADYKLGEHEIDIVGCYDVFYTNFFTKQAEEVGKNMQHHALNDCYAARSAYVAVLNHIKERS
jgi:hypothetical protein